MTRSVEIRRAAFADIPEILACCEEAHRSSSYAATGAIDTTLSKQLLCDIVMRQADTPKEGATMVVVAVRAGLVEGVLIGVSLRLYHVLDALMVTDLIWYARPDAHPTVGLRLLRELRKWADGMQGPGILRAGVTDAIGSPDRTAKALEVAGMTRIGHIYEKEITP